MRARVPAPIAVFGVNYDSALADTADPLLEGTLLHGSRGIFLRAVLCLELPNLCLKFADDLSTGGRNIFCVVYRAPLGCNGSYRLAASTERADTDAALLWPCGGGAKSGLHDFSHGGRHTQYFVVKRAH